MKKFIIQEPEIDKLRDVHGYLWFPSPLDVEVHVIFGKVPTSVPFRF
jgi:hypothetical protein